MIERQTKSKRALREIFASAKQPLTPVELMNLLEKSGIFFNKTTIYRELDRLREKGEIAIVYFADGHTRYEMTHGDHHHHAVCTKCKTVIKLEIESELEQLQVAIAKKNGFTIRQHLVEFFGMCRACVK